MIDLTSSNIEYLKAIYDVSKTSKITVTNISKQLHYSKPSVVRGLKNLQELDLIKYDHNITITELGLTYINNIMRKDSILKTFLIEVLKIDEKTANKDAEAMKKDVSCYTITRLEEYLKSVLNKEIDEYENYCIHNISCCKHKDEN